MDPPEAGRKGDQDAVSSLHTHTAGAGRSSICLFAEDNKNSLNLVLRCKWGGVVALVECRRPPSCGSRVRCSPPRIEQGSPR